MFELLIALMLTTGLQGTTATTQGQYVEMVNVQYDVVSNTTYGILTRYAIDGKGSKERYFNQLRSLKGNKTKADLNKTIIADYGIKVVE